MSPKPQGKSWAEIQLMIAAFSITATLGFWNVFAGADREQVVQTQQVSAPPPPPLPTATEEPIIPTPTVIRLAPVKIIFGGPAPQQQVIQVAAPKPAKKNNGNNGNNNSDSGAASVPAPAASTGSSKP